MLEEAIALSFYRFAEARVHHPYAVFKSFVSKENLRFSLHFVMIKQKFLFQAYVIYF